MDSQTIVKQLKKALACKDDKEMRMRVEVVVDVLEETNKAENPFAAPQPLPQRPQVDARGVNVPNVPPDTTPRYTMSKNGEQLNYTRPAGT